MIWVLRFSLAQVGNWKVDELWNETEKRTEIKALNRTEMGLSLRSGLWTGSEMETGIMERWFIIIFHDIFYLESRNNILLFISTEQHIPVRLSAGHHLPRCLHSIPVWPPDGRHRLLCLRTSPILQHPWTYRHRINSRSTKMILLHRPYLLRCFQLFQTRTMHNSCHRNSAIQPRQQRCKYCVLCLYTVVGGWGFNPPLAFQNTDNSKKMLENIVLTPFWFHHKSTSSLLWSENVPSLESISKLTFRMVNLVLYSIDWNSNWSCYL